MTNRSRKKSNMRRRTNPVARLNRPKIAPKVSFDGTRFNAHWYPATTTTAAFLASAVIPVDTSNTNGGAAPQSIYSAQLPTVALTGVYEEYHYNQLHIKWLAQVAPGVADAGSRITAAYFDNPETISNIILASTSASLITTIKGCRNAISWNAWENFTYKVPLTRRRKWFDVNTNNGNTTDIVERSTQGVVAIVFESISAVVNLGQLNIIFDVVVKGLSLNTAT